MPTVSPDQARERIAAKLAALSGRELFAVEKFIEFVSPPPDDEQLSDAGRAALLAAIEERGANIPHVEVLREFGL